jgi:hypothetical protein
VLKSLSSAISRQNGTLLLAWLKDRFKMLICSAIGA